MLWTMELTALIKYASILDYKISIQKHLGKEKVWKKNSNLIAAQAIPL